MWRHVKNLIYYSNVVIIYIYIYNDYIRVIDQILYMSPHVSYMLTLLTLLGGFKLKFLVERTIILCGPTFSNTSTVDALSVTF